MSGTAIGIGVGPGDPELITLKGARLLGDAGVVAYPAPETGDSLARRIAAPHLPENAVEIPIRMPISTNRFPVEGVYDRAAGEIGAHLADGRDVVILCEGDPFSMAPSCICLRGWPRTGRWRWCPGSRL